MSEHMKPQITEKKKWYEIEGTMHTEYIEFDLVGNIDLPEIADTRPVPSALRDYSENITAWAITIIEGFGARMSAPDHTDKTEWAVFETIEGAREFLKNVYEVEEKDLPL